MNKAVFFDIDGTLWDEHMRLPDSTGRAIRALRAAGNYAFLCSGRSRANIRSEKLMELGFDGIVASCGAHLEREGEIFYESLMTDTQVEHVLRVIKENGLHVVLEGPRYIYVEEGAFLEDPYVVYLRRELGSDLRMISGTGHFEINKLSAVLNGAALDKVTGDFGSDFAVIAHGEQLIELIPAGHSKATGIAKMCEACGIAWEDTYAFGDSANDLDMLHFVAHGIAMGNGTAEAKEAAEFVTASVMEDGVEKGLLHYGLI